MIYAAFTLWFVLVLFAGVGVYRLWTGLVKPAYVHWALLPGTAVSEMAYIFGCLITGGEIRRAKLIEMPGGKGKGGSEPSTDASPGLKGVGGVLAALMAMAACVAAILLVRRLLGSAILDAFAANQGRQAGGLPRTLPLSWADFWAQLDAQLVLLRQMCETLAGRELLTWRGLLFVYLAACLSVRLSPVTHHMRPTLAAVVVIAAGIGLLGLVWPRFSDLMGDLWPLLTYIWASLLLLLVLTLLIRGLVAFGRILAGGKS